MYCYTLDCTSQLGFVTDGEFNSLRTRGEERPVQLHRLRADIRNEVSKLSLTKLRNIFIPTRTKLMLCGYMHDTRVFQVMSNTSKQSCLVLQSAMTSFAIYD